MAAADGSAAPAAPADGTAAAAADAGAAVAMTPEEQAALARGLLVVPKSGRGSGTESERVARTIWIGSLTPLVSWVLAAAALHLSCQHYCACRSLQHTGHSPHSRAQFFPLHHCVSRTSSMKLVSSRCSRRSAMSTWSGGPRTPQAGAPSSPSSSTSRPPVRMRPSFSRAKWLETCPSRWPRARRPSISPHRLVPERHLPR